MIIHEPVQNQVLRCPRCGNKDFSDVAQNAPFICPVIGCGCVIDPNNMPIVIPDPERQLPNAGLQDQSNPGGSLIYDRDENGDVIVKGVYGEPSVITIPTMFNGRAVMGIAPRAFAKLPTLRRITLPDTVTVIGEDAFADCRELESITFGAGLTLLDRGCLRGCSALYEVTLPEKLREIGREAFADCTQLEAVTLGGSVQIIRDNAFSMCTSLSRLTFARRPAHIAVTAFSGCYSFDETALFPDGQ